ncbi:MAG: DUF433 domain-containing protein [Blastocatellia bacterium]
MSMTTTNPLIEILPRGPSIAGTRITVYSVMDSIKANCSKEEILAHLPRISSEQLDAVYEYIEQHREEVEAEYALILQNEAEARVEAERIFRERSPFPPDMPWEEKHKIMIKRAQEMNKALQSQNGDQSSTRP